MEVTLSRIIKDWIDDHELSRHFITEYPGRESLIIRHPASNKMVIFIFYNEIMLAYFEYPLQLKIHDPKLFQKLDEALRLFVSRI